MTGSVLTRSAGTSGVGSRRISALVTFAIQVVDRLRGRTTVIGLKPLPWRCCVRVVGNVAGIATAVAPRFALAAVLAGLTIVAVGTSLRPVTPIASAPAPAAASAATALAALAACL